MRLLRGFAAVLAVGVVVARARTGCDDGDKSRAADALLFPISFSASDLAVSGPAVGRPETRVDSRKNCAVPASRTTMWDRTGHRDVGAAQATSSTRDHDMDQ